MNDKKNLDHFLTFAPMNGLETKQDPTSEAVVWRWMSLGRRDLDLEMTLFNGQAFLWRRIERDGASEFYGCIDNSLFGLRYMNDSPSLESAEIEFCVLGEKATDRHHVLLAEYFSLAINLQDLRSTWCKADQKRLSKIAHRYEGIRVLTIDHLECLVSFISSSNNNIKRISQMMLSLCAHFPQNRIEKTDHLELDFFHFPSLSQLSQLTETTLRELGFGFRAPFIVNTIKTLIRNGGLDWLRGLAKLSRIQACAALQTLPGCGPKVANCFCMCSLRMFDSVPVDTHCLQLMRKHYITPGSHLLRGSLSVKRHEMLGDILRSIFGAFTSWAFMLLFTAELSDFRPRCHTLSRFFVAARKSKPQRSPSARPRQQKPTDAPAPTRLRGKAAVPAPAEASPGGPGQARTQAQNTRV
jgi:N-glycosylase/DNA lyase